MSQPPLYSKEIKRAINQLIKEDHLLFENGACERAITHKLAEHLQKLLPEWNVDCEYNRKLQALKTLNPQELKQQAFNLLHITIPDIKTIYPDIIVHHRGTMSNKIVIEVKIEGRPHNTEENRIADLAKLAILTDSHGDYKYDIGYFITLPNTLTSTSIASAPEKAPSFLGVLPSQYQKVYEIKVTN